MAFSLSDMFSFNPDGSYKPASDLVQPDSEHGYGSDMYQQNDQGQVIGWSPYEGARRQAIDNAYYAQQNGTTTTDFSHGIPSQLGSDVYGTLAMGGTYNNNGNTVQFNPDQGNLLVSNPGGKYVSYYNPSGQFERAGPSGNTMSPLQGLMTVAGAATGFGAIGALAAGGSIGLGAGLGAAGMIPKALMPSMMNSPQITSAQSPGGTGDSMAINPTPSFGGLGDNLSTILGNLGTGLSNVNLGQALSGFLGAQNTNQAGQSMIDFLKNQQTTMQQQGATAHAGLMDYINGQQSKIDGLYNPGTPEANAMQQAMEAKDAAAGRNSQYGVRSVDLAAKLAALKGGLDTQFASSSIPAVNNSFNQAANNTNSFTQGTSRALADALTQRANAFPSAVGSTLGNSAGGGIGSLAQLLGGGIGGAGSLLTQLFGSGGNGLDGMLNGISDNGFNATAGSGLSIPSAAQADGIFNNASFNGMGNTDFMNFDTNSNFGGDMFNVGDISDWFQ